MAAPCGDAFDTWLSGKLVNINPDVDLEVFVTYIRGVLESETDEEDIDDAISGILGEITEDGLEGHCVSIRNQWQKTSKALTEEKAKKETLNIDQQLSSMMEKSNVTTVKPKAQSEEERARKAAILAQYAQVSDGDGSEDEGATGGGGGGAGGGESLTKISNAEAVASRERDMRDRAKKESDEKKTKDKEDREKQKQKVTDRKEKEKVRTQKGERRR